MARVLAEREGQRQAEDSHDSSAEQPHPHPNAALASMLTLIGGHAFDAVTTHMRQGVRNPKTGERLSQEAGFSQGGSHFQNPWGVDAVLGGQALVEALLARKLAKNHPKLAMALSAATIAPNIKAGMDNIASTARWKQVADDLAKQ